MIRESGLSTKKYLEKWITIYIHLGMQPPLPNRPNPALVDCVNTYLDIIAREWNNAHPSFKGQRRENIKNINFLFQLSLLKSGYLNYITYANEFPVVVSDAKYQELVTDLYGLLMRSDSFGTFPCVVYVLEK